MSRAWVIWLLVAPAVAFGGGGKVGKAVKALDAFAAGDREALDTAREAVDAGLAKAGEDPAAWAVRGRVFLQYVLRPELPAPAGVDPAREAVDSYEKALALGASGAVHAGLASEVPALESAVVAGLLNEVEGKQWATAQERLALALRARAMSDTLNGRDAEREAAVRRLAVQVTAQAGDLAAARSHYETFVSAAGREDPGLAVLVARKLADKGDGDGALAFLAPLSAAAPDDERLLRAEVDLMLGLERGADAIHRVDQAWERLATSVSGAFLAAGLYAKAGAEEKARSGWERVLELDPRHLDSLVALAGSLTRLGQAHAAQLSARAEEAAQRRPDPEITRLISERDDAWARAEASLATAAEVDGRHRAAAEARVALYEAQVAGVDRGSLKKADQAAHDARLERLQAARAALAALEE